MLSVVDSAVASGGEACGLDAVDTLLSLLSLVAGDVDSGSGLSRICVVDLCDSMARINIWSPLLLLGERQVCSLRSSSSSKLRFSLSCFAGGMQQFNNFSSFELLLVLAFVVAMVGDANGETLFWDSATGEGERVGEDNAFDARDADDDRDDTEDDTLCVDCGEEGMGDEEPAEDNAVWLTSVCAALAVTRCCTIIIMRLDLHCAPPPVNFVTDYFTTITNS